MGKLIQKNKILIIFIFILLLASFFRLWQITELPAGLFPDEAANGLDILLIFAGQHSPFFERGLGREALFFYLQAISVALFGIGVWQLHLVSALIGIATVLATWFLAKKLFNERVAFFTSFFLATSTWHTTLSRTGFRAILVPLFATLFFYFAYLILKESSNKKRKLFTVISGLSLGLGFYTYISFRAMIVIIPVLIVIIALFKRELLKKFWRKLLLGIMAMLLILIPLIVYFANHPDSLFGRSFYISIFNPDLNKGDLFGTFLKVTKKTFLMFFTEGDLNWRHNVSGFSMLNPWVAIFFALGFLYSLFIILKRFLKQSDSQDYLKHLVLIIWFLGMLGPELMSAEAIPHGLRAIGAMPAVFFFPALMIDYFWQKMKSKRINPLLHLRFRCAKARYLKIFWGAFLGLILLTGLLYDFYLYFGISANSPDFYYAYRSDLTVVSNYLNERNLKEKTYLVLDKYSVQTPEFLTAKNNQPYILIDPATSYQTQLKPNDQIVFTQSTIFDAEKFKDYNPEVKLLKQSYNQFNQEIMRIYEE